jgi:TorA maturation chaperone TorD
LLAEAPGPAQLRAAEALELRSPDPAEYTDVFVLQLYPYASVYLGAEGMLGGEARDRVAGFWRALHLKPPPEPDHLAVLLSLYATLIEHEAGEGDAARRALCTESRRALLWEHLLTWLPQYLLRLRRLAAPAYGAWADLLGKALVEEASRLAPPGTVPLHFRDLTGVADPREEGGEVFLGSLLAPARAGFILIRADLADAARDLGLGLRQGERRYVLGALLSQDGPATLAWLARLAVSWVEAEDALPSVWEPVTDSWSARAGAAAELLSRLAAAPGSESA